MADHVPYTYETMKVYHKPPGRWTDDVLPIEGSFYVVWYKRGAPMVGNHIHKGESLADRWNWSKGPVSWAYIAKQVATT